MKAGPFGSSLKKAFYVADGYKIYGQEQVIAGDPELGDYFIDGDRFAALRACEVLPGDILISLVGTIGKVLVIPEGAQAGIINPRLLRLSLDESQADPRFTAFLVESDAAQRWMAGASQGGTMGVLNASILKSLPLRLPPLSEQRKIAAILGSVDALIERTQAVIDQVEVVKKGLMQELLTRGLPGRHTRFKQTEIGEIPESWEVVTLGDVVARIDSGWSPRCESVPAGPEEWGVLKVSAATWGRFRADENKRLPDGVEPRPAAEVHPGDLILSRANTADLVARPVFVTPTDARLMMSDKLLRLVPGDLLEARFLKLLLEGSRTRSQLEDRATGSSKSMKNISQAKLRTIAVPLPALEEQLAMGRALDSVEERLDTESRVLSALGDLKVSLSSVLLSGELRVQTNDSEVAA
ncbi:MAG: restriction endonuclease subunit S [Myxococcota bacterium]